MEFNGFKPELIRVIVIPNKIATPPSLEVDFLWKVCFDRLRFLMPFFERKEFNFIKEEQKNNDIKKLNKPTFKNICLNYKPFSISALRKFINLPASAPLITL